MTHHTPFTRLSRLILGLLLGTALLAGLLAQLHATARAATAAVLDVCATCSYTTIQSAVDAASPGDTVRVAAGTYQDVVTASGLLSTTVLITKDLTLLGGFSPDFQTHDPATYVSTIDGQNSVKGIYVFGSQAHVAGFTIVNGLSHGVLVRSDFNGHPGGATLAQNVIQHNAGTGIVFYQASGEVLSSTVAHNLWEGVGAAEAHIRIADNVLTQNSLGGIWAGSAAITITGNTILSNTAEGGAGITLDNAAQFSVTHNLIQGNQAQLYSGGGVLILGGAAGILAQNDLVANTATDHGGGIAVYQNGGVTLSRNELRLNSAVYGGGGIHVNAENGSTLLTISENAIHDNTAEYATGVQVVNSSGDVLIDRNDVRFNHATGPDYSAGGIHVDNITGTVTVVNNVVAHNDNRGVKGVNYTEIVLINNTLVANGAVAIEMHAWPITAAVPLTATLINNIIADHPDCALIGFNGAVFVARHNDVVGHDLDDCGATIVSETGGLNADPLFVAAAQGDYRLAFGSPAIDSGTPLQAPAVDIAGNGRPQGSGIDMGAHEAVRYHLFLPGIASPLPQPSDNFTVVNRQFGGGYAAYSGDIHAWVSATDGWGFAPQSPTEVAFYRWDGAGWHLHQTLPGGGYFYGTGLQMITADDGWAVAPQSGTGGPSTFFHWNGAQWAVAQTGIDATITALDFRSAHDGWAAGNVSCCGTKFYHWDGAAWSEATYLLVAWPGSDIDLLPNGDGWAVGTTIARLSGGAWTVYGSPTAEPLNAVSMVSADDGWIVGSAGTILHWDGSAWTAVASPTTANLRDVHMLQANHGWAVGENGTILRWNGSAWSLVPSPVAANLYELHMLGINDGWIPYYDSATSVYGVLQITTP